MSNTLTLLNVRLSYPHIFKPKAVRGSTDAKYSASFILDKKKDAAQIKVIQATIEKLLTDEKKKVDPDKRFLKDGATKPETYGDDVMFVNANNATRPQVVNRDRSPILETDNIIYGGCYVNAVLNVWVQDNTYGKRVNATLEVVQFVRDGEAFGRKPVDVNAALPDLTAADEGSDDPMD